MFFVWKATIEEIPEIKQILKKTWIQTHGWLYPKNEIEKTTWAWHDPELLASQIQNPDFYFATVKNEEKKWRELLRHIENPTIKRC